MIDATLGFDPEQGHPEEKGEVRIFMKIDMSGTTNDRAKETLNHWVSRSADAYGTLTRRFDYEHDGHLYAEAFYRS